MTTETYNGWANYETWNVALWLQNDEKLYRKLISYVVDQECKRKNAFSLSPYWVSYTGFINSEHVPLKMATDDGVRFDDPNLNYKELDAMVKEILE